MRENIPFSRAMLKRSTQKRCVWIVLALFSAIAVAGDGLHFLPGLGHDCRESHLPLVARDDCHRHDNASGQESELIRLTAGHRQGISAISPGEDGDHCPVCQYFTQAKTVPLAVAFEIDSRVVEGRIPTNRPLLEDHFAGAYSSRAPPVCG